VDTVDKMQGQECDAVIVSYGVSDPEVTLLEGEFIYSLNRLNVAVTRARMKSIVFLPMPLLMPTLEVMANEDASERISYMDGLVRFAEEVNPPLVFDLDSSGSTRLTIYRRYKCCKPWRRAR
jgi:hypothetical protein